MTNDWRRQTACLKYLLGSYPIGSVCFDALVRGHTVGSAESSCDGPNLPSLPRGIAAISRSQPVGDRLPRLAKLEGYFRYVPRQYRRYYTQLRGVTFESYLKGFSAKSRATLLRKVRRFGDLAGGHIDFREYRRESQVDEFLALARPVSARSYQEKVLGSGLPAGETFAAELRQLSREDRLRAYVLMLKSEPVAYMLCPAAGDTLLYKYVGYDPQFAQWSPGTVLQYCALKEMFEENRFANFDYTEGEGQHKEQFSTDSLQCADIYWFPQGMRSALLIRSHMLLSDTSAMLTEAADSVGIKRAGKRLMRWVIAEFRAARTKPGQSPAQNAASAGTTQ